MDDYRLRKADINDSVLLYEWANDEEVRKNSFNSSTILYSEHVKWFNNKMISSDTSIYIFLYKDEPIGVIRLEKINDNSMIINYSIDKLHRGRGNATKLLGLIKVYYNQLILIGKVKKDNIGSIKAFLKSGYLMQEDSDCFLFYSK